MKIKATLLAALIDFASYRGVSKAYLYQLVENEKIDWCSPENFVGLEKYLLVLDTILIETKDPLLGLAFGRYLNLSALGIVHEISLQTKSIEQALLILEAYLKRQFPIVKLSYKVEDEKMKIKLDILIEDAKMKKHIFDSVLVLMTRELLLMLPRGELSVFSREKDRVFYQQFLSYSVEEGEEYSFEIPTIAINESINSKSLEYIELVLPQYLKMVHQDDINASFVSRTRNMILHLCSPELPNMKMVCEQLALSSRSFQRKLKEEGSSFRKISLELKQELSLYLEAGKQMKTQDIAYILGYSEASAYINARKKWKGSVN